MLAFCTEPCQHAVIIDRNIAIPTLTSFKCSIHSTSKGILNSISVESFHTAGIIGVRIEVVEDKVVHTGIFGLKGSA